MVEAYELHTCTYQILVRLPLAAPAISIRISAIPAIPNLQGALRVDRPNAQLSDQRPIASSEARSPERSVRSLLVAFDNSFSLSSFCFIIFLDHSTFRLIFLPCPFGPFRHRSPGTSASLLVTSALLVVTMLAIIRNKKPELIRMVSGLKVFREASAVEA